VREAFEACIRGGGVAVFGADTVYGLACDPADPDAVARVYALKGRSPDKPAALMFFSLDTLPALGPRTRALAERLLPGPVTLLVPDPDGGPALGIRVPDLPALAGASVVVLQTSANLAGGPDPRRLEDVPASIRDGADLVLDAGELPGTPSTVIDLRGFESGEWEVVREGALPRSAVEAVVAGL
jgi:L-threonylcarbamoyladenylate synthase